MKNLFSSLVTLAVLFTGGNALAQSAKNAVQVSDTVLLPEVSTSSSYQTVSGAWVDLLHTTLKTSQQKDLIIQVSLEAGLGTDTLVRSKNGEQDSSTAKGRIEVQVLVDGYPAAPGTVTFAERYQHLMAQFGGILQSCTDVNGDGVITADECYFTPEELQLVLRTMNANSFTFALDDVGVGTHDIRVQARVILESNATTGSASASAWIGKGSISVEEVRLVKGTDITL